jgi:hypothetical protein
MPSSELVGKKSTEYAVMTLIVLKSPKRESSGELPGYRIKNRYGHIPADEKSHISG